MDKALNTKAMPTNTYSLRKSTIYAKEHLHELENDIQSVSYADSSFSSKPKRRHGKKIKKHNKSKRLVESSGSEEENDEEEGIEPNSFDVILLNKLPAGQKELKAFKLEVDKHVQKYKTAFFQEIQNTKRKLTRDEK